MRDIDPIKLNLEQMWRLYKLLEKSVKNPQDEMFDNVSNIVNNSAWIEILEALRLMYKDFSVEGKTPVGILTLLTDGLQKNEFFQFVPFIRAMK